MFDSEKALLHQAAEYAKHAGFRFVKRGSRKKDSDDGRVICERGGKSRPSTRKAVGAAKSKKTDCPCRFNYGYRATEDKWVVNKCELTHNHGLQPGRINVPTHVSELSDHAMEEIRRMVVAGILHNKIRQVLLAVGRMRLHSQRPSLGDYRCRESLNGFQTGS